MQYDIETRIEPPPAPKKRGRPRKQAAESGKPKKEGNPASQFLDALKFISVAQKKNGPVNTQFCNVGFNWVAASNDVITVAHPITEDLEACPQTVQLIAALSKAASDLSITQLSQNTLCVSSGVLRALVPCVGVEQVPITGPDPVCANVDGRVLAALGAVQGLATEGAATPAYAAVLLQSGSAVATNGAAILEAWHANDLPKMLMPKVAAKALSEIKYQLTNFGFSGTSATFYFENGAWLKTQLYDPHVYPNYEKLLQCDNLNLWEVPSEFFAGVRTIEMFNNNDLVFLNNGVIKSDQSEDLASTYKIDGVVQDMGFNVKYLLQVEHAFKKAHFDAVENKVIFYGDNVRGALKGIIASDDIPF